MTFDELPEETKQAIRSWRFDRIIEKHEGPERWDSFLTWVGHDLIEAEGKYLLLPVEAKNHANITILRSYASPEGDSMTVFLKDTTLAEYYGPGNEMFWAGFLAICERPPGVEDVFVARVYHEWFIVEPSLPS